jgi:hypothetical protein
MGSLCSKQNSFHPGVSRRAPKSSHEIVGAQLVTGLIHSAANNRGRVSEIIELWRALFIFISKMLPPRGYAPRPFLRYAQRCDHLYRLLECAVR